MYLFVLEMNICSFQSVLFREKYRIVIIFKILVIICIDFYLVYLVKLDENQLQSNIIPLHLQPHAYSFAVFSIQFSVDCSEIICGSSDSSLYVFDLEKQRRTLCVIIIGKIFLI